MSNYSKEEIKKVTADFSEKMSTLKDGISASELKLIKESVLFGLHVDEQWPLAQWFSRKYNV